MTDLLFDLLNDISTRDLDDIITQTEYIGFDPESWLKHTHDVYLLKVKGNDKDFRIWLTTLAAISDQQGTKLAEAISNMPDNPIKTTFQRTCTAMDVKGNVLASGMKSKDVITPGRASATLPMIGSAIKAKHPNKIVGNPGDLPNIYAHAHGAALIPMGDKFNNIEDLWISWNVTFDSTINRKRSGGTSAVSSTGGKVSTEDKIRNSRNWAEIMRKSRFIPNSMRLYLLTNCTLDCKIDVDTNGNWNPIKTNPGVSQDVMEVIKQGVNSNEIKKTS